MSVHLRVPFQVRGGHALTVLDGSLDEIAQNVRVIVATLQEERTVVPNFGLAPDPTFGPATREPNPQEIIESVARWEPRAELTIALDDPTTDGTMAAHIQVSRNDGGAS